MGAPDSNFQNVSSMSEAAGGVAARWVRLGTKKRSPMKAAMADMLQTQRFQRSLRLKAP